MLNFFITSPGVNNTQLDKSSHNSQNEKSLVAKVDLIQSDPCFVYSPAVSEKEYLHHWILFAGAGVGVTQKVLGLNSRTFIFYLHLKTDKRHRTYFSDLLLHDIIYHTLNLTQNLQYPPPKKNGNISLILFHLVH